MLDNWKTISMIIVFDILFVLLLVNIRFILINLNMRFLSLVYNQLGFVKTAFSIILMLVEMVSLIIIYSFFKYMILSFIVRLFKKKGLMFSRFISFVKVNLVAFIPIMILLAIYVALTAVYFSRILSGGVQDPLAFLLVFYISVIIAFIMFTYSYTLLNLFQSIFIKERSLKKITKKAFLGTFHVRSYGLYWHDLKVLFFFGISLLIVHILVKLFIITSIPAQLKYGGYYTLFLKGATILVVYFLLLFNRLKFYLLYNEAKKNA